MKLIKNEIDSCWWCGSKDLSREHKIKKTDIKSLYGDDFFKDDSLGQLKFKTHSKPIPVKSAKSKSLQFEKSICKNCNNSRSTSIDKAYQKVIEFVLNNTKYIYDTKKLDFEDIFDSNWKEGKMNFFRYLVKYTCCRMVESKLEPFENLIEFLNGESHLRDAKFVFQIKPYEIGDKPNPLKAIYTGKFNIIEIRKVLLRNRIIAASSWYSINDFSMNYLLEKNINKNFIKKLNEKFELIEAVDMFGFDTNVRFSRGNEYKELGELIEDLEYYPFTGENRAIDHYNYMKNY